MDPLFHRFMLSSGRLLRHYLDRGPPDPAEVRHLLFLDERDEDPTRPDHLYKSVWRMAFKDGSSLRGLLRLSVRRLAEDHAEFRHTRLCIRAERFAAWQRLITRVPVVPLVTSALRGEFGPWERETAARAVDDNLRWSTLPSVAIPPIDDLVETEGLYDLHVHLNGTTEACHVWQDALRRPDHVHRELKKGYRTTKPQSVREQYDQIEDGLTPERIHRRLRLARYVRHRLVDLLFEGRAHDLGPGTLRIDRFGLPFDDSTIPGHRHPVFRHVAIGDGEDAVPEAHFLWRAFDALERPDPGDDVAPWLHLYLLIAAQFTRLTVQQVDQKGFDQFQKITVNEARSRSEQEYRRRFHQLARNPRSDLVFLEGRFAPKQTARENWCLLHRILEGYNRFHDPEAPRLSVSTDRITTRARLRLGLVAHFIKEAERSPDKPRGICRHANLRVSLERRAVSLLHLHRRSALVQRFLVGMDAASNELHAPPEVFAPIFARFRAAGFTRFTYHAGEDFRHILSGMRAVMEAVEFLDLRRGNRIGHATALGLDPALWWRRIGGRVVLGRGEWLDDLVFAYVTLGEARVMTDRLMRLRDHIGRHARRLYGDDPVGPDDLVAAWRLRRLDPLLALDPARDAADAIDPARKRAWAAIGKAKEDVSPAAWRLFERYHAKTVRRCWDEPVEVTDEVVDIDMVAAVQRAALAGIVDHGIVLESMPTSNVRIGVYDDYDEHHILRWLGLEGDLPRPEVVVASDDPGIFANFLRGEFIHLHRTLMERLKDEGRVMDTLRALNRNARVHRFRSAREEVE